MVPVATTETEILSRLFEPDQANLSPEAARSLLAVEFSPRDLQRMDELAERARGGTLSDAEQHEIQSYTLVGSLLGIIKSKARRSLKRVPSGP